MNDEPEYILTNNTLYKYDESDGEHWPVFKAPLSPYLITKERAIELYEHSLAVKEETQCTQD